MSIDTRAQALGLAFSDILLPAPSLDLEQWAVIAVDQFTSDPSYWEEAARIVGDAPSTLHIVQPEAFLDRQDDRRVAEIHATMRRYRDDGTLRAVERSAVYVRRTLGSGVVRRGLVIALDLERYDYRSASDTLVRASEETIPSRLPARAAVRRNAPLESPHILVLYDDPERTVEAALEAAAPSLEPLYRGPLMLGGGSIEGLRVPADADVAGAVAGAMEELDRTCTTGFLFAAGDGNHSLAAARTIWEERRAAGAPDDDPARFCLVELVNVHDEGLPFEPIHRLVRADEGRLLEALLRTSEARFHGVGEASISEFLTREQLARGELAFAGSEQGGILVLPSDSDMPVAAADRAIETVGAQSVDYIHGTEEVLMLAAERNEVALVLPALRRDELFATVERAGVLPRKAFSLGEARDKRYYLECRALLRD